MKAYPIQKITKTKRNVTHRAFWKRVTREKYAQLIEMAKTDALMEADLAIINGAEYIDLDDPDLVSAFNDLQAGGMFTQEDSDIIFADALYYEETGYVGTVG